jgi:hypothetical protein
MHIISTNLPDANNPTSRHSVVHGSGKGGAIPWVRICLVYQKLHLLTPLYKWGYFACQCCHTAALSKHITAFGGQRCIGNVGFDSLLSPATGTIAR